MKKLAIGVGIVIALLVVVAIAVPFVVPVSVYKDRVITAVRDATGRELRVDGAISFSIFPNISLNLGDVSFSDAPGTEQPMVTLSGLQVSLRLMPLLSGAVEINGLEATNPVIRLSRDKQGVPNWLFSPKDEAASQTAEAPAAIAPPSSERKGFDSRNISLDGVKIINGTIVLDDQFRQMHWEFKQINLSFSLAGPDAPLTAKGDFVWNDQKTAIDINAARPFDLIGGKASALDVSVAAAPVSLSYKGTLALNELPAGKGVASLAIPSVPSLAQWLDLPLPAEAEPLKSINFSTKLDADGKKATLDDLALSINDASLKGSVSADLSGARPAVKATLDLGKFDMRPLMALAGTGKAADGAKGAPKAAAGAKPPVAPKAVPADKSASPADIAGLLHTLDADVTLTVAPLIMNEFQIDKARLALALKDGKLMVDLSDLLVAQGSGKARLTLDGTAATPVLNGTFAMSGLRLEPLLAVAGQKGISGVAGVSLTLAGQGKTIDALTRSVTVKGPITLEKGTANAFGIKTLALNGTLDGSLTRFVLNAMSATINDVQAKGSFGVDVGKGKPAIVGSLDFGRLDLRPFMQGQGGGGGAAAPSGAGGGASAPAAQAGWSTAPIDFSPLRLVDADLTISAQPLITDTMQLDRLRVAATLKGGKLAADIPELALYGGSGRGKLAVDASGATPSIQSSLNLSGLQVEPLLGALADTRSLTGTLALAVDVTTQGASQHAMVSSLGGRGSVTLSRGAIRGVDLARIARNVTAALGQGGGSGQTEFSQMSASFTINRGVVTNPDLKVESPVLLLEGNGTINLPNRTLAYRLNPKKVPILGNQPGLQALLFPVVVSGPWSNPSIAPDLQAALQDPSQIIDRLRDGSGNLPNLKDRKGRTDALRGLLQRR